MKKISVIIPVYNVSKYLRRCLDSVISQTYRQLEIILIDDGSTDGSSEICDEYAKKDNRIVVIHKPNGGVSVARNSGLAVATGDYIGFVDSDDYIHPNMYKVLVDNAEKYDADISICGFYQEDTSGKFHRYWKGDVLKCLNTIELIENLLVNKYYRCSVWDRIFKKELLSGVNFREDVKIYEDMLFDYEVMKKSNKAIFTSTPMYYYCENDSHSAARSPFNDSKMDIIKVLKYILTDIDNNFPEIKKTANREYMRNNIMCADLAVSSGYKNIDNLKLIQKNIRAGLIGYLFSSAALGYKYSALLIAINWRLYRRLRP